MTAEMRMPDARVASLEKSTLGHGATPVPSSSDSADCELGEVETHPKVEQRGQFALIHLHDAADPDSPRNWSNKQKWITVLMASAFGFITAIASSMLAPALPVIGKDLAIVDQTALQMVLSIFVLAYGVGPLVLGPLSEVYGRVRVMQCASAIFLVFNLACGFAQNYPQMLAFRFLAGIGASAPQSLCGGIMADCFSQQERGAALRVYTLATLLAPAVGPIMGGIVSARTTWRWMFWAVSIANAVLQICAVFLFRESWEPLLLEAKAKKMQQRLDPPADSSPASVARDLARKLTRAVRMLLTQPIIIVVATYTAYLFGLSYLMLSTFAALFTSPQYYGQSLQVIISYFTPHFLDWLE
ncbi:hypothetical protein LTR15_003602 [Elasticomyces elasticus]|nr:hypothetical protein LTR15_003602 [Elasticomyces elasticus]